MKRSPQLSRSHSLPRKPRRLGWALSLGASVGLYCGYGPDRPAPSSNEPVADRRQGLTTALNDCQANTLVNAIHGKPPGPDALEAVRNTLATLCPYRGLLYFREEDAPFFFGREAAIAQLTSTMQQHSLVAVVGASGSGKSSVVRAGLVPELRKSRERIWEVVTMVPTDRPVRALAAVLLPFLEPGMTETDRLIELNKLAGEPMEVLVNDKLVARGEAVVVNEKFGVRLTDIISPTERVEQLK